MKKILLASIIGSFSLTSLAQNVAPSVPVDTVAGNGHTMKTELKIDVKDDIDKIVVKHSNAHSKLITKTFELKEADPTVIRTILTSVVDGSRDQSQVGDTRVESIRYKGQDITGVIIVTAAADRFEQSTNGAIPIPQLVKMLDQPLMLDLQAQYHFQVYTTKHKPANELKELVERNILDITPQAAMLSADISDIIAAGGPAAYLATKQKDNESETKFGNDFVIVDKELNQLFIACAPSAAVDVKEFLKEQDKPYENLNVNVTIYEVANKDELDLGNDFNEWKNSNTTTMLNFADGGHTVALKAELDAKFFEFMQKEGKAKVYSSMNMVLRPNKKSTFDQRKIKIITLAEGTQAADQLAATQTTRGASPTIGKTSTSKKGDMLLDTTYGDTAGTGYTQSAKLPASLGLLYSATPAAFGAGITAEFHYGTSLNITPFKQGNYSKLVLDIDNISLVGFNDDGSAKSAVSTLDTEVVVKNDTTQYVAGYLSRKEVVQVTNKVPLLGSIPLLGYLFSTEDEQTKTHQLVVVVSCKEESYNATSYEGMDTINEIKKEVEKSDLAPEPGYDKPELFK